MIVFNETTTPDLLQYGIEIPVLADRKRLTFQSLLRVPQFENSRAKWHLSWPRKAILVEDALRVHAPQFIEEVFGESPERCIQSTYELYDRFGKPNRYSPHEAKKSLKDLRDDLLVQCYGTYVTAEAALSRGFAYYLGGGLHHAHFDHGSGFCLLNDIVVAIRKLQSEGKVTKAWVIDVDAHKGDGTAALTQNDDSIATLSIHMARGWPLDAQPLLATGEPNPAFVPSTIDLPIEVGQEACYLNELKRGLKELEAKAKKPDIVIVVNGSDPFEEDILASASLLKLSLSQMFERDRLVYEFLKERNIPQAYVMAGGYGPSVWKVHAQFIHSVLADWIF